MRNKKSVALLIATVIASSSFPTIALADEVREGNIFNADAPKQIQEIQITDNLDFLGNYEILEIQEISEDGGNILFGQGPVNPGSEDIIEERSKDYVYRQPQPSVISDTLTAFVISSIPSKTAAALVAGVTLQVRDYCVKYPVLYVTATSYKLRGADGNIYYSLTVNHFTDSARTNLVGSSYSTQRWYG